MLDLLRGIAALLVCAGHIRNFLFVDFGSVENLNLFDKLFYFLTGLGHQAVIVFFVLSGYFVGGSVWKKLNQDNFRWGDYAITRLTRLWMVLIPALLATLAFDHLGKYLIDSVGYDGKWHGLLSSGPGLGISSIDLTPTTFLGNVFFLQTIAVPVFGSNGPLWSLANEFWYYLVFPFVAIALHKLTSSSWLIFAGVVALYFCFPAAIVGGFLFWLMGWLAAVAAERIVGRMDGRHVLVSLALFFMALVGTKLFKLLSGFNGDLLVAVPSVILLLVFPSVKLSNRLVVHGASVLSDMSYSLYLFHFPFVAFCWFVFIAPIQLQPTLSSYVGFFALLATTVIFCFAMWWLFERHTNRVRTLLKNQLQPSAM